MQHNVADLISNSAALLSGSGTTKTKLDKFYINTVFDYKNELSIDANGQVATDSEVYTYELSLKIKKQVK